MKTGKRHAPSGLYNVRNTGRFRLRREIYFGGQNYRGLGEIAPFYYVGWDGEVARYDPGSDAVRRVGVRRDLRVRLFPGEGRRPADVRLDFLVASAWKENRCGYAHVLHRDGNVMNCRAVNLKWVGSWAEAHGGLRGWAVEECGRDGARVRWPSVGDAAVAAGFTVAGLLEHLVSGEPFADGSVFRFVAVGGRGL